MDREKKINKRKICSIILVVMAVLLPLLGLVLLRIDLKTYLGLTWAQAWEAQFIFGVVYDLAIVAAIGAGGYFLNGLLGIPKKIPWIFGTLLLYVAALANLLHYKFTGVWLKWWIIQQHWQDLAVFRDHYELLLEPLPLTACGLLLVAIGISFFVPHEPKRNISLEIRNRSYFSKLVYSLLLSAACAAVAFMAWYLPCFLAQRGDLLMSTQIFKIWFADEEQSDWHLPHTSMTDSMSDDNPAAYVSALKTIVFPYTSEIENPYPPEPLLENLHNKEWPLFGKLTSDASFSTSLRHKLGLPAEGPLNILVIWVESLRAYEFTQPQLATSVLPRLSRLFDEHGLYFSQAYSSVVPVGRTVRSQFATSCSFYPNNNGAATFMAHSTLRINCLAQLLRDNGYLTVWMNSYNSAYRSKRVFEMLHGTDKFFDENYYISKGINERIGSWGLADAPFLQESVNILKNLSAEQKKPIYASILTVSTNAPYSIVPGGDLDTELLAREKENPEYIGYLSRLRYADEALGNFFADFFELPMAENTLVVLLGDHGVGVPPFEKLNAVQQSELEARVPIVLLSKNMTRGERFDWPVQQIDIAPTIAHINGLETETTWLGRGLFAVPGSPHLAVWDEHFHLRFGDYACYTLNPLDEPVCYNLAGRDPLLDSELPPAENNSDLLNYVRGFYVANQEVIMDNKLMP